MSGRPGEADAPRGLAGPRAEKTVSLALQGGGAHGAFTWGVLDVILEDGRLAVEAITGASAGSMNAVVMADGWLEGGADGARAQLEKFWRRASIDGAVSGLERTVFDRFIGYWSSDGSPAHLWMNVWANSVSPYETNPLDINPLRGVLDDLIDFERLRRAENLKLFIAATNVWTGKARIFETAELTAEHVMASACLPLIFQAVEIDGVPYWDGGYMGNPALYPLFYETRTDDVILVQINPVERHVTPRKAHEIQNRLTEITFNGGLLRELRAVDFVLRLIEAGKLSVEEYKPVRMHRIDGCGELERYTASSRLNAEWRFFRELRDVGRKIGRAWIDAHYDAVGRHATLDLRAAFS